MGGREQKELRRDVQGVLAQQRLNKEKSFHMRLSRMMWYHYGEKERAVFVNYKAVLNLNVTKKLGKSFFMTFCFSCFGLVCFSQIKYAASQEECTGNAGLITENPKKWQQFHLSLFIRTLTLCYFSLLIPFLIGSQDNSFVFNQSAIFSCLLWLFALNINLYCGILTN